MIISTRIVHAEVLKIGKAPHLLALTIFPQNQNHHPQQNPPPDICSLTTISNQTHPRLTNRLARRGQ